MLSRINTIFRRASLLAIDMALIYLATAYASGWEYDAKSIATNQPRLLIPYGVYLIARSKVQGYLAAAFVAGIIVLLGTINTEKMGATGEPLLFYDLFQVEQAAHMSQYMTGAMVASVSAFVLALFLCILSLTKARKRFAPKPFMTGIAALTIAMYPYYPTWGNINERVTFFFAEHFDTNYLSWHLPANLRVNGLPFHLLFTSVKRNIEPKTFDYDARTAKIAIPDTAKSRDKVRNVIMVLCESCWDNLLDSDSPFKALREKGFAQIDVIAPVYGGGTANAEFEVLTGLPSRNLTGVIYQEYKRDIVNSADTIAATFKKLGYHTVAAHNFFERFWSRKEIYPKLGFDEFVALEQMEHQAEAGYPKDHLVFDIARQTLRKKPDESKFLFLITVSTHGPYKEAGDGGYNDYSRRLRASINELTSFTTWLDRNQEDYLLIVFGDHRPALNRYFYDNDILPKTLFRKTGPENRDFQFNYDSVARQDLLGRVPLLMKTNKKQTSYQQYLNELDGKPLFCLRPLFARFLTAEAGPAILKMQSNCALKNIAYKDLMSLYTDEMYFTTLFQTEHTKLGKLQR